MFQPISNSEVALCKAAAIIKYLKNILNILGSGFFGLLDTTLDTVRCMTRVAANFF